MNPLRSIHLILPTLLVLFAVLACGLPGQSQTPEAKAPLAAITVGSDLSQIDVCKAIPQEDIEAVIGRKLTSPSEPFEYSDTPGETSGCSYQAGKDADGNAYFGYVVLTPISIYNNQPLSENKDVSGIGDQAYFNNGADARQLWVRIGAKVAFVVAFGDAPNEEGAKAIAKLLVAAIQ